MRLRARKLDNIRNSEMEQKLAIKRKQAAELLSLSEPTMRELEKNGTGPQFREVGSQKLYGIEQINRWLDGDSKQIPVLGLRADEAAFALSISLDSFNSWVRHSDPPPPSVLVNGCLVFPLSGLQRWLEQNSDNKNYWYPENHSEEQID